MAAKFEGRIDSTYHHESVVQPDTNISEAEAKEFQEWESLPRSLRIVVTGKTGAGKSTLLNGFVGGRTRPFKEGSGFDPETLEVQQYTFKSRNVEVTVWDCPGLQDGTKNEDAYLRDLREKTNGDIDVMLYCISLENTKFNRQCHGEAMQNLTQVFGQQLWKHTVVVLTFGNYEVRRLKVKVSATSSLDQLFEEKVNQWKTKIQGMLLETNCTENPSDIENIQVVPAGFRKPSLPNRKFWLSHLWIAIFATLKTDEAKAAAIALNKHRFRTDPDQKYPDKVTSRLSTYEFAGPGDSIELERPPPVANEEFNKDIEDQPIVITPDMEAYLHKVGVEIITASGIGAVTGATIGGLIAGVASVGIATPVGAGVGGMIGGGIGLIVSTLFRVYKHRKATREQSSSKSAVNSPVFEEETDAAGNCDYLLSLSDEENADNGISQSVATSSES